MRIEINAQNFWNTNLEDLEAVFLKEGQKITDLPSNLDDRVPSQGSVLLDRTINIDDVVPAPSFLARMMYKLRK